MSKLIAAFLLIFSANAFAGCASILSYGGNNTDSADNTAALASAISAQGSQACVFFPAGTYEFLENASETLPSGVASLTLVGSGQDVTDLVWPSGGGLTINYQGQDDSVHVRDLSILTGTTDAGSGLALVQASAVADPANTPPTTVDNVTIRGADGYAATDYWAAGISDDGVSNVNVNNTSITGAGGASYSTTGTGITDYGSSTTIPVVFNLSNSFIQYVGTGFNYGNYAQGVTISQSNLSGDNYGVVAPANHVGLDQLSMTDNQINANVDVYLQSPITGLQLSNNYFIVPTNGIGVYLEAYSSFTYNGNIMQGSGPGNNVNGLVATTNDGGSGVISGNTFNGFTTAVWLQSGSTDVNVQSNSYANDGNTTLNQGTNVVGGGSD